MPRYRPIRDSLPAASAPASVRGLLAAVRREIRHAEQDGRDWRAVIDALRPDTQELWCSLPLVEKRRFLRHLRPGGTCTATAWRRASQPGWRARASAAS
jgi:uncharacterized NAD(P)/FAD-binding protein YdhS